MWIEIAVVGLGIGFLGGLFGKGGSAVATPLLYLVGVPAIAAVASPLPATIPGTLVAADAYRRAGMIDRRTVLWSCGAGLPATVLGALATKWIDGSALVVATEVILVAIGVRLLLSPSESDGDRGEVETASVWRLILVGGLVGLAAGLLANSGGFLLAPLYLAVARLTIKPALAASLAVSAVLAVPGTLVHAALGHIDWAVTLVLAATSVPASRLGAKVAIRTASHRLERLYGGALIVLGIGLLLLR
jgi:uncharacterized membrane protein YfcA